MLIERYAEVVGGVVVNVVMADATVAAARGWLRTDVADIGWAHDGTNFIRPADPLPPPSGPRQTAKDTLNASPDSTVITVKDLRNIGALD